MNPSASDRGMVSGRETAPREAAEMNQELFDSVADGTDAGRMRLVFHAGGKLETVTDFPMARGHKTGRWSWLSYDADAGQATVSCQINSEQTETRITFVDNDRIKLIPPNIAVLKKELLFERATPQ